MSNVERGAESTPPSAPSVWEHLARTLSPVEQRPRVVDGIEAARQVTRAGEPYVVVRSPAGTYLKLEPREYELLGLMDGSRSVKALAVEYYHRHGVLALPKVAGLVRLLQANRFLDEPAPWDAFEQLGERLRDRGLLALGLLQHDIAFREADQWLGRWYRAWGYLLFSRAALLGGTALGLLGLVLLSLELGRGRYDPFLAGGSYLVSFLLLAALDTVSLVAHELGHGLATKHAGRRVPKVGLMLYFGVPTFYVETTDIWLAPRRMRLLASYAGPWADLMVCGLCALAVFLLPEGPVGAFLFAWGLVAALNVLFNFCPLLELDGYYMLVDLVEKPMLRARSLAFVRGPLWTRLLRRQALRGDERLFAWFGLGSALFSALAVLLAVQFWQVRLGTVVREVWASGQPLMQATLVLFLGVVGAPLLAGLWGMLRGLVDQITTQVGWLGGRAAAYRRREALAALRSVPLWAELPEGRLLQIARALHACDVEAGTEVVRQGEAGDRFYLIASGTFEVQVDQRPVARLGSGDYFGERALLYEAPRAATVIVVEPSRVFWLDRAAFQAMLAHDLGTRARLEAALAYRAELAQMPLFQGLAPAELDLLLTRFRPTSVEAGQTIVRQGAPGDCFYVIRSGGVEVLRDGHQLTTLGPGEAFGEIALLLDVPRTATVRALEATELLTLNADDFQELLASYCGRAGELERLSHLRLEQQRQPHLASAG